MVFGVLLGGKPLNLEAYAQYEDVVEVAAYYSGFKLRRANGECINVLTEKKTASQRRICPVKQRRNGRSRGCPGRRGGF